MEEILPGLVHWSAFHEGIERRVHSSFLCESGTLLDPMQPEEGLDAIADAGPPQQIVLSSRHHFRDSAAYAERFQCPVLPNEAGLAYFQGEHTVRGFKFSEQLAADVRTRNLTRMLDEEFDARLFAYAGPVLAGGREMRECFLIRQKASA